MSLAVCANAADDASKVNPKAAAKALLNFIKSSWYF
jgi:hypothetical protein